MNLQTRDATIDGLKFVAAGAIVLHHVSGYSMGTSAGALSAFLLQGSYWGLFFFFAVSGYFHGATGGRGARWLGRRLRRLGVPYAVWSLVYLCWGALSSYLDQVAWTAPPAWRVILFAGAHEVLWSLPMLMICALLADTLVRTPLQRRLFIVFFGLATVATFVGVPPVLTTGPLRQFVLGARWVFVYALGMECRGLGSAMRVRVPYPVIGFAGIVVAGAVGVRGSGGVRAALFLTAVDSAIAVCMLLGARAGAGWLGAGRLASGGRFLLGVYVSHYLWLELFLRLSPPSGVPAAEWIPVAWASVFLLATVTAWALASFRFTRPAVA